MKLSPTILQCSCKGLENSEVPKLSLLRTDLEARAQEWPGVTEIWQFSGNDFSVSAQLGHPVNL